MTTQRLDFTALRQPGRYAIVAGNASRVFRIVADVFAWGADTLLHYMREQRAGWNPLSTLRGKTSQSSVGRKIRSQVAADRRPGARRAIGPQTL